MCMISIFNKLMSQSQKHSQDQTIALLFPHTGQLRLKLMKISDITLYA